MKTVRVQKNRQPRAIKEFENFEKIEKNIYIV